MMIHDKVRNTLGLLWLTLTHPPAQRAVDDEQTKIIQQQLKQ